MPTNSISTDVILAREGNLPIKSRPLSVCDTSISMASSPGRRCGSTFDSACESVFGSLFTAAFPLEPTEPGSPSAGVVIRFDDSTCLVADSIRQVRLIQFQEHGVLVVHRVAVNDRRVGQPQEVNRFAVPA